MEATSNRTEGVPEGLELSERLVEWYWSDGIRRSEKRPSADNWQGNYEQFGLPTGTWLRQLYEVRDGLLTVKAAASSHRPSVALWGMSQTGKSTSVSALIDSNVQVSAEHPEIDGTNGGLHWQGGLPFFFVAPYRDTEKGEQYPMHWYERSLNPFNSGMDASSALSRFVAGSKTEAPGRLLVDDPMHPVRVELVPPSDLLHALARGFDSECLGPALKGKPQEWTPERLDRLLAEFREKHRALVGSRPNRESFERMLAVVGTLNELVFGRLETFAKLKTTEADWQSRLESLLANDLLISDPNVTDEFAAQLFWNGSAIFSERFLVMRRLYQQLTATWGCRPVHASLPAAMLLLDMAACVNAFREAKAQDTREGKQQTLIKALGWRKSGQNIYLGCGPDYPEKLGSTAEQFSNFQGLVWELVVPINTDNLKPGPFRDLIETSDVLDFPGVGRDEKNETNRLNANPGQLGADKGKPCTIESFYSDIVKRGKTASIVATYSRRLTVDSFSILQNIDKDEPSNHATDQLTNGIRTWMRNMAPGFTEGAGQRPSGVFLNLGLTFWGEFVQQSKPDKISNFETRRKFYSKLGLISDPEVVTVFALNYHWIRDPRVKFTQPFTKGAPLYERVVGEPDFQRLFKNPISVESLEEMTADLERGGSGGADFLFGQLRIQVLSLAEADRASRFASISGRLNQTLANILSWRHLRKPQVDVDTRLEELNSFVDRVEGAIAGRLETDVRMASHALCELLNVDPESLGLPPSGRSGLSGAFVEKLYNEWKDRQVLRYDEWLRRGKNTEPDWSRVGLRDRDDIARFLEALITSLNRSTFGEIAALGQRVWDSIPGREEHRQKHLRRYIAIEMTNHIVYKAPERKPGAEIRRFRVMERRGAEPVGKDTLAYAGIIGPFTEVQLADIKAHLTPVILRPSLFGDEKLETILGR